MDEHAVEPQHAGDGPEPNTLAAAATPNALAGPSPSTPGPEATNAGTGPVPGQTTSQAVVPAWAPPRTPRNRGRLAALGVVVVALAGIGAKLALGFFAATVVGSALGSFFGGPLERLPADQRQRLESRFEAVVGDSLKGLSETDADARLATWITGGIPRLGDAELVDHERIWTAGLLGTDITTCAAVAHATGGKAIDHTVSAALLASIDPADYARFVEINIDAIEADTKGSPQARTVPQAASDAMINSLSPLLTTADTTTLQALSNGATVTDTQACAAFQDLYAAARKLNPTDLATFALFDVTP